MKVDGVTITGTKTWTPSSAIFVSGRTITIPTLWVCDHEVTRGEFKKVMGKDPSAKIFDVHGNELTGNAVLNNPVTKVSWYDAIAYCNKLSVKEGLIPVYTVKVITDWENFAYDDIPKSSSAIWDGATCNFAADGYRLPTEAEWEYLARGGNDNTTYAGSNTAGDVAWYKDNTNLTGSREVKTKLANGYGLYDMSGNVWEWCWDWHGTVQSSTPPTGPSSGSYRVTRGGSWYYFDGSCAVACREYEANSIRSYDYGFRVVRPISN